MEEEKRCVSSHSSGEGKERPVPTDIHIEGETKRHYDKRLQSTIAHFSPDHSASLVLRHILVSLAAVLAAVHTSIRSIHAQVLHRVAHGSATYTHNGKSKGAHTSVANDHGLANLDHGGLGQSPLTVRVLLVVGVLRP